MADISTSPPDSDGFVNSFKYLSNGHVNDYNINIMLMILD